MPLWYDYHDQQLLEVHNDMYHVHTADDTHVYPITAGDPNRITDMLDRYYSRTRNPGRRPHWMIAAEERAQITRNAQITETRAR